MLSEWVAEYPGMRIRVQRDGENIGQTVAALKKAAKKQRDYPLDTTVGIGMMGGCEEFSDFCEGGTGRLYWSQLCSPPCWREFSSIS